MIPENSIIKTYKQITVNGKQVRLHRHIMENHLNRKLKPSELVHHIDGNIHNNSIKNLKIVTRSFHAQKHEAGISTRFKTKYQIKKETLEKMYCEQKMTILQIAKALNVSYGVIWSRLKLNGIAPRKQGRITD